MKRVSKAEWLEKALEVLSENGIESVKIEFLSKKLGISKGGFYWHFRNRDDLLRQMLDYWSSEFTDVVLKNHFIQTLGPEERIMEIMRLINDYELAKYDLPIRAWGQHDPVVKKAWVKVMSQRMKFFNSIMLEIGHDKKTAETLTRLFLGYHSWEYGIFKNESKKMKDERMKLRLKFFTKK